MTTTTTAAQRSQKAHALMLAYGLTGWRFRWDRAVRRCGQCNHTTKTISMSGKINSVMSDEEFMNTLTHEIAHALVGPRNGHNNVWRAKHIELGGNGLRQSRVAYMPPPLWVGVCPGGHRVTRQRLTKFAREGSCPRCSPTFSAAHRFTWTKQSA